MSWATASVNPGLMVQIISVPVGRGKTLRTADWLTLGQVRAMGTKTQASLLLMPKS